MAHTLRKNLPNNTLYNSQTAAIVLVCGMVFKLSALPGMVAEKLGSSTLWAYIAMAIVEIVCICFIYSFTRSNGDSFLSVYNSRVYRVMCALMSVYLTVKGAFYFCFAAVYITHELFAGIAPMLMFVIFLAPIVYLGIKGIRTIARSCEIFCLLIFFIIMFNLVFLKTDMDIERNFPIFAVEPSEFFSTLPMFGLWIGDMLPLMFVRLRNKRIPYNAISIGATAILVIVIVMLGVAMYGDALPFVSNLLIRISGFNQLSYEIGRMDLTNIFCVLTMAIFSLSLFYWGACAASERAIKSKMPMRIIYPAALLILIISLPSAEFATKFVIGEFGYVLFGCAVAFPPVLYIWFAIMRKRNRALYRCIDAEYLPYPREKEQPDSIADNILVGEKSKAEEIGSIQGNGTVDLSAKGVEE